MKELGPVIKGVLLTNRLGGQACIRNWFPNGSTGLALNHPHSPLGLSVIAKIKDRGSGGSYGKGRGFKSKPDDLA